MGRFCPPADCKGGVRGADIAAEGGFDFGAEGGVRGAEDAAQGGFHFGAGARKGVAEDVEEDAAEEEGALGTKVTVGLCNGKRDCTDCSDRWDLCDWWGFLEAACAVRCKRSAMSRTTESGMSRK